MARGDEMKNLTKGECESFAQAYLQRMDPEAAAGMAGLPGQGARLLTEPRILEELDRQKQARNRLLGPEDVLRRLAELAFGRVNDCVRLALDPEAELEELDLSLLGEIKRSDKGVELKLVDRVAVLEKLMALLNSGGDAAAAFFQAMQGGEDP